MYRIRPTIVVSRAPHAVSRAPLRATIPRPRFHQSRFYLHIALGRGAARFFLPPGVLIGVLSRWVVSPAFYRNIGLISAGAGGIYLYNLEQVPVSGRWRFNIVPSSIEQAVSAVGVDKFRQTHAEHILPEDDPRVQMVEKVLARLLLYAEGEWVKALNWEVTVIDSMDQNAWAYAGGKIFFSTGMLSQCKDENDIAVVLGHEIAHVVARHTAESLTQRSLVFLGVFALSLFDTSLPSWEYLIDRFLRMPASRKQEAEADYIGLMMMAQGCYKPQAAIDFWARMEKMDSQGPTQILSTHPSHHDREKNFREWLPKAIEEAEASECFATSQFANQSSSAFNSFGKWLNKRLARSC